MTISGLKVLFCASESVPFSKTGGLADVAGSLPIALEKLGAKVIVTLPKYKGITSSRSTIGKAISCYFIENDYYFDREGLYGDSHGDYPDNLERFQFYCEKTIELLKEINFKPDIVHCNDWQSALVIAYLKTVYRDDPFFTGIKTVFTIHNAAYQGVFEAGLYSKIGIDEKYYNIDFFEFYGKINLLKAGIVFADFVTTVSPTYAEEIQTKEFGCGLESVFQNLGGKLSGILNGIDYDIWDPAHDRSIYKNYDSAAIENKYVNKLSLQKELGLTPAMNTPLIGMVGRLAEQKGFDLVSKIIDDLLALNTQFVILGKGDAHYHKMLETIKKKYAHCVSINLNFNAVLAQNIYAGSDIFLMPSRFEPCGLGQMAAFRYGSIPIARRIGGIADTVLDYSLDPVKGNGFTFDEYSPEELFKTIQRALAVYKNHGEWMNLVRRAMAMDFSWDNSAKRYIEIYKRLKCS